MAEPGIDKLFGMVDSKYRLTVVVAKRAQQLLRHRFKNTVLEPEERPKMRTLEGLFDDPQPRHLGHEGAPHGAAGLRENLVPEDRLQREMERLYPVEEEE